MLQKALGCLFVFGIAPVGIGGLWTKGMGQKREKILNLYLAGCLSELVVFQLIAVPVMVKEVYAMNLLVYLTTAVFTVLAAVGFIWTLLWERYLRKQTGRNEDVNQQQAGQAQACSLRKSTISGTGNGARNRIRRTAVQNPERLLFWHHSIRRLLKSTSVVVMSLKSTYRRNTPLMTKRLAKSYPLSR